MSGRTPAEIMAMLESDFTEAADLLSELDEASRMGWLVATKLGDELREIAAKLPACPTCGGTMFAPGCGHSTPGFMVSHVGDCGIRRVCPDCVDGKVPIERVVKVFEAVHGPRQIGGLSADDFQDYLRGIR